nr:hypothetical protein [Tanacetum cinerariifolium]
FLRYVDTRPNGEALRKCILSGPYKPTIVLVHVVEATNDSPAVPEHSTVETPTNMSLENKAHFLAEKEAIHLILTGIGDDIYSTVDACQTAQEMLEAIERLQQGESLSIQDVNTNLFWEFRKFTSHDGESMETGIGDEIYSTVDACQTTQEMWEAIERLQQGESLNIQDVKTNLFWEFGSLSSSEAYSDGGVIGLDISLPFMGLDLLEQ